MPNGVSAKNSARTNYNFYKNTSITHSGNKRGGGFNVNQNGESPIREVNQSNDMLPNLNVKVLFSPN
jgi:hypothetical protein